jgi:RHS repeat-associated protein
MLKNHGRYRNMIQEQSTAASVGTTCLAVSASTNQVTGTCAVNPLTSYTYDANGNMLGDGVNSSMTYDAANHLISLYNSSSGGAAYVYDGNGNRVKKCVPNCSSPTTTTVYIFSGSKVIAEYPNGATGTSFSAEYLYAGGQLVATIDSSMRYHHSDHLSARLTTDTSGNILGQQGHYPFGESWYLTSTTTKWEFTTYERDAESGNDYAMARYNVNRLGRFSSIDPLSGNIGNPQSLNHYTYVTNDPINGLDPMGMSEMQEQQVGSQPGSCTLDGITTDCGWVNALGGGGGIGSIGLGGSGAGGSLNFFRLFPESEGEPPCDPGLDCDPLDMNRLSQIIPHWSPSNGAPLVGGSGGGPNTTCGQPAGPSKVYNGSLTTGAPAAWLGSAIGGFAGGYYGAAFGAIIGSTFGIGVGGSYVPSTHSLYLGPTAVFSPFGGAAVA